MEALIPKLFILTAEASIVLFLILIIMVIFNIKTKRKDLHAANELVRYYTRNKEERIPALKRQLKVIGFEGDMDEQAEKLFKNEKSVIKEFVTLYLRRDTYRLLDYPDTLTDNNDIFLKTSGSVQTTTATPAPNLLAELSAGESSSEETANATILAREQAEANDSHLKELSELRLKNTELNEQLFEALETITELMTEHGKKTDQEVESNAQKILEAIIYLRDKRLEQDVDPSSLAPSTEDDHDQVDNFDLAEGSLPVNGSLPADDSSLAEGSLPVADGSTASSLSVDLAKDDDTLDDSTAVSLGITDGLNIDLDSLMEDETISTPTNTNSADKSADESQRIDLEKGNNNTNADEAIEDDPWADALAEQASAVAETAVEDDPWAEALAEQATAAETADKDDPWAEALAEQEKSEKK